MTEAEYEVALEAFHEKQTLPFAVTRLRMAAHDQTRAFLTADESECLLLYLAYLGLKAGIGEVGAPGHNDPVGVTGT